MEFSILFLTLRNHNGHRTAGATSVRPKDAWRVAPQSRVFQCAALVISSLASVSLASSIHAQGKPADYARANGLRERYSNKIYRAAVRPEWLEGTPRFWYRNDLPGGKREFVLVEASTGEKRPAFDHAKVAEELSKALGRPVTADKLPVERIAFVEHKAAPNSAIRLQIGSKAYIFSRENYALLETTEAQSSSNSLPLNRPLISRSTGGETNLTFVNQIQEEVTLYWMNTEGERTEYGKIRPGERREQHTYAGHVWLITRANGTPLAAFEAKETPETAIIDGSTPRAESGPRQGRGQRGERGGPRPGIGATSPDSRWRVELREQNVFLLETATNTETRLTQDGSAADAYGGPVVWLPDSTKFVVTRTIPAQEHKVTIVESSPREGVQPKLRVIDYLKPGDRIAHPRPRLFDVAAKREIPVADTLFPTPWDISEIRWEPDSKRFTFLYNQRGHQVMRLIAVDSTTGAATAVIDEQTKTFIDWTNKVFLRQMNETNEALWMSERDGWNHLYLYDTKTGQVKNQITKGAWVVRGVDRVDTENRQIWFRAGGIYPEQDPYHIHYCRINFDGTGLTKLTEGDGTHTITYSPDNKTIIDTYSRVDLPPVTELRSAEDGRLLKELERADISELKKAGWRGPERFVAKARDGVTDIWGVIVRPSNFNPNRKYPVIENIYAGPQGSFVPKAFSALNGMQALAELGFIVVQMDGMGTNNRSKAFHDVCWKNLGDAGFPDRILWIKAAAAKYPYIDITRVGIYGTSAGGQNALGGLLQHGDFYKAGMADCGCHDNRMDKIWWNEQWMGWPVGPHYEAQSNVTLAPRLTGKLLLMVGEADTNVDPASTMQVVNALVRANKDFEFLVIPGAGHGVAGSPYGRRRMQDFFVRHLLKVEPPERNRVSLKTD